MSEVVFVWQLILQTFYSLARNWAVVLKITLIPLILPIGLLLTWFYWSLTSGDLLRYMPADVGGGDEFPALAATLMLIAAAGTLPVAVAWHRFDLLGERPRALWPRLHPGASFGYFGRMLLLGLIGLLTVIPIFLVLFVFIERGANGGFSLAFGGLPSPTTLRNFIVNAVFSATLIGILIPWALILPARALGHDVALKDARLAATERLSMGGFVLLALVLHLASIGTDLLLAEIATSGLGSILLQPFVLLFTFMFNIALLTRLYALCVEPPAGPETPNSDIVQLDQGT